MDRQRHWWIFTGINVIAIALMLYIANRFTSGTPRQVSYSEFLVELRAGKLTDVQITERELIGVLKSDSSHPKPTQELTIKATRLPGQAGFGRLLSLTTARGSGSPIRTRQTSASSLCSAME